MQKDERSSIVVTDFPVGTGEMVELIRRFDWSTASLGPIEGWPEVADFNDNVMKVGLSGRTLAYKDQELTLHRSGKPEQVWMNLDYSPVIGEDGRPARRRIASGIS